MTLGECFSGIENCAAHILRLNDGVLSYAIALAVFGAALRLFESAVRNAWGFHASLQAERRRRRRACVDFYVDSKFQLKNLDNAFGPSRRDIMKAAIDDAPRGFVFYGASIADPSIFDEMRTHRHKFTAKEMILLEKYIGSAKMLDIYYAQMQSEKFGALSRDRKKAVVDQLFFMAQDVRANIQGVHEGLDIMRRLEAHHRSEFD